MKTLTANWNIVQPTPLLEDTLAQILSDEIAKEIDNEVLISMLANWPDNLYTKKLSGRAGPDLPYGWAGELAYPNRTNFADHMEMYMDMVRHINTVVNNPKQNACWNKIGDCVYVMFRKQKDMDWFVLKYGA